MTDKAINVGTPGHIDHGAPQGASELKELLDAVKAIRASDCGAWQKDCMGGLFKCSEGRAKRMELGRLLDQLYKVVGI